MTLSVFEGHSQLQAFLGEIFGYNFAPVGDLEFRLTKHIT